MEILQGLMAGQVLCRNKKDVCSVTVSGKTKITGVVQIRVAKKGRAVKGFNFKPVSKVIKGKFSFKLVGIPVGGPYNITLRNVSGGKTVEEVQVKDILVGDVWILAGQSNMEGVGAIKDAVKSKSQVRAFYMYDEWAHAKDPIHNLYDAIDDIHGDLMAESQWPRRFTVGTGPGVAFGQQMHKLTGVPQGLISCAHGGTSMAQWNPALKSKKGKSLYGAMLRRFHKNGANATGVVWYQGCSDAIELQQKQYTNRMKKFVASVRKDFGNAQLPFVTVQISRVNWNSIVAEIDADPNRPLDFSKEWNSIQNQQRLLPTVIKKLVTVPAIDLSADDSIHVSGKDQQRLGKRLANGAMSLLKGLKKPIELKTWKIKKNYLNDMATDIVVNFANVEGKLTSKDRPNGFALTYSDGSICDAIYRIDLDGNKAILRTNLTPGKKHKVFLSYGHGASPYCNITDTADRSLPVFGPCKLFY